MPKNRYFLDKTLETSKIFSIEGDEFFHIKVLRPKIFDEIELINGKGILANAQIVKINKNTIHVEVLKIFTEKPSKYKKILAQSILKANKLSLVIEKATELGIDEIYLIPSKNSERTKISENEIFRLKKIAISATKQSSRLFLPKIKYFENLDKIDIVDFFTIFGSISKNSKNILTILDNFKNSNLLAFVGPEKGFNELEISYLKNNLKAVGVSLNPNILRAETAAIVMSSFLTFF